MRRGLLIAGQLVIVCSALCALGQTGGQPAENRAKPPDKWDRRVLETFFPDARASLVGPRPGAPRSPAPPAASPATTPATGTQGVDTPASESPVEEAFAWSQIISVDTLQDEIKSLQPLLSAEVQSQQKFLGGGFKRCRNVLGTLAAMFAIVQEYDGDVKWKTQAAATRDAFARAAENCKAASQPALEEAKSRADDLAALLRGESSAGPPSAEAKNEWSQVAPRQPLMARMELAQKDRITPWTANANVFKRSTAALLHEAEIVSAVSEIVTRKGYEYQDDQSYLDHARALGRAAAELSEAIKKSDYQAARNAAGAVNKACNACHSDFR